MGTPAFIGMQKKHNGSITGVYCHAGNISFLGRMLYQHYHNQTKTEELINLGNLSSVGENPDHGKTVAYIRDMNRPVLPEITREYQNLLDVKKRNNDNFYAYFIYANGKWYISERGNFLHPLSDALEQMNLIEPPKIIRTICKCATCQAASKSLPMTKGLIVDTKT